MGTLADLTKGFQSGYGFTAGARRERQLDKLYDLKRDELERKRATEIDSFEIGPPGGEGGDLSEYGLSKELPYGGMTLGEKLKKKIGGWFTQGAQQEQSKQIQQGEQKAEERAPSFGNAMEVADGGLIRGHAGPVRKAIETRRAGRTFTPNANASYADGGRVPLSEVDPSKLSPEARAQLAKQQAEERGRVKGDTDKYRPAKKGQTGNAPRGKTARAARYLGKGAKEVAKKGALPVAAGFSAAKTATTDTDEYRRRYGMERTENEGGYGDKWYSPFVDDEFYKDVGVRAIGAAEDFGNTLLEPLSWLGLREGHGRYEEGGTMAPPGGIPADAAAAVEQQVPPPEQTGAQVNTEDPPGQAPARAAAQQQQAVQLGGSDGDLTTPDEIIDMSSPRTSIPPDEIPRHTTKEWEENRNRHMRNAMLRGDDPWAVGDAITKHQITNFTAYMYQAQNLIIANDHLGAARALTAGYQYFPNGSDVSFGLMKGKDGKQHLVGMGRDEKTGEPMGTPYAITPEMLGTMMEQASDPKAWRTWTKDWHAAALDHKKYELERDYKERSLAIDQEDSISNRMRAEASQLSAMYGGVSGGGGLPSESQVRNAIKDLKLDLRYEGTELELTPDQTTEIAGFIGAIYRDTGILPERIMPGFMKGIDAGKSPEEIYQMVMEMLTEQQGQAIEGP